MSDNLIVQSCERFALELKQNKISISGQNNHKYSAASWIVALSRVSLFGTIEIEIHDRCFRFFYQLPSELTDQILKQFEIRNCIIAA